MAKCNGNRGKLLLDTLPIKIKINGTGGEELPQVLQARGNFALRCLRKEAKVSPREPFAYVKYNSTHGNRKVPYPFQSYQTIVKQERILVKGFGTADAISAEWSGSLSVARCV